MLAIKHSMPPQGVLFDIAYRSATDKGGRICNGMQKHDGANKQDKVQVWEEQRPVSKYALGLHQESSTGKTIPSDPSRWACAETGVKENLWLNLSTGVIGSGRQVSLLPCAVWPCPGSMTCVLAMGFAALGSDALASSEPG